MTKRRARRIRNLSRVYVDGMRRKTARTKVRFCVLCPVLNMATNTRKGVSE